MPTVVNTETSAASNSTSSISRSRTMRARRLARRSFLNLQSGFALEQLVDRHADFRHAAEHRALLAFLHALERHPVGVIGQRHVLYFLCQLAAVLHVVLDELLDLGLAVGLRAHID